MSAAREQAIRLAELDKEQQIGEQTAAFEPSSPSSRPKPAASTNDVSAIRECPQIGEKGASFALTVQNSTNIFVICLTCLLMPGGGGVSEGRRSRFVPGLFVLGLLLFSLLGCGGASVRTEVPAAETNMRNLAVVLGQFTGRHQGRGPRDEEEFKEFLRGLSAEQMRSFGGDVDKLFISPADSQPYVIRYNQTGGTPGGVPVGKLKPGQSIKVGPDSPYAFTEPVVAYEKTGVEGKRYIAYQTGKVELVDEARFQQVVKP